VTEPSTGKATESREQRDRRIREVLEQWIAQQEAGAEEAVQPGDQLLWEHMGRPPRGPRPTLTHDQIAAAAVEIADADGLGAVTMRRLAARLDVATMSLYRYVRNKEDVWALMVDAVAREITLPAPGSAGWRETFRRIATEMRAGQLRHPWLGRLQSTTTYIIAPSVLSVVEAGLASLDAMDIDLDVDEMMAAFAAMTAYVQGKATAEVAQREAYRRYGWSSDDDMRAAAGPQLVRLLARGGYPTLAHYMMDGSNRDDAEWGFTFGLECVLDGIAARLGL
jgi:AcrR family transcriptional regulator